MPLSFAEAADSDSRYALQLGMDEAVAYAEGQYEYAGMMLDQLEGGRPIFWFTDLDDHRTELAALVPAGADLVVMPPS